MTLTLLAILLAALIFGTGIWLGACISRTNPSNERPVVIRRTAVIVAMPRRTDIRA